MLDCATAAAAIAEAVAAELSPVEKGPVVCPVADAEAGVTEDMSGRFSSDVEVVTIVGGIKFLEVVVDLGADELN
jgi:hypothetical protein